ncbi:hypothetical protein [Novosphingobium sp.]|uniref:hypothetical protein n=1 Tax=Novosphingobium sp. TaxID=1874826 RepID=UPI00333F2BD2
MLKAIVAAALVCVSFAAVDTAEARVCRNRHGQPYRCHKVFAPRINFKAHHPIKVTRCRSHNGKLGHC